MPAQTSDILIIGGGVAGLSAAAAMASSAKLLVLEAEDHVGFHASGRSATMVHYALGNTLVRELTRASRPLFDAPPDGFADAPIGVPVPILVHARADEVDHLRREQNELSAFTDLEWLDEVGLAAACPLLRVGDGASVAGLIDHKSLRIDQHALLQGYVRILRAAGGAVETGIRAASIERVGGKWVVTSAAGRRYEAPVLVNAAGAWADAVAKLAGVESIGLKPKRRTIITFDAPAGVDTARLPFTKTVGDALYFAGESGRLFASPMDEVDSDPCDAQPDEFEVALGAQRMEERTTVDVRRIHSKWAGLRSFAPDRRPVAGFASDAEGFFWLAGQGGFGLQTSPAMAAAAASLVIGTPWPLTRVRPAELSPDRFAGQAAEIDPAVPDEVE